MLHNYFTQKQGRIYIRTLLFQSKEQIYSLYVKTKPFDSFLLVCHSYVKVFILLLLLYFIRVPLSSSL